MRNLKNIIIFTICLNAYYKSCFGQSDCQNEEWKCNNGQCILHDELCDGHRDCSDGSDESAESCLHIQCPSFSFKCSYGACIGGNGKCNNIKDCDDNSDESGCPGVNIIDNTTDCAGEFFECDNGKCISIDLGCDGKIDCPDGSDETSKICSGPTCPAFAFQCGYGACINGDKKCDGVDDCIDGSDESNTICDGKSPTIKPTKKYPGMHTTNPVQTNPTTTDCLVTFIPYLIIQTDDDSPVEILPGQNIGNYQGIKYSCQKRHLLTGENENRCVDGNWTQPLPKCIKYCPNDVLSSVTIQTICNLKGNRVSCLTPILPGTRASISCAFSYQKTQIGLRDNIYCEESGEWDYTPYRCEQVCGEEYPDYKPFILGGTITNNTKVPWNVGIYSNLKKNPNEQVCGGTIISARIVISAAHCFWNVTINQKNDKSYYKVGAGKFYRNYNAVEPLPVQFTDVEEIHITDGYKDVQLSYINDIAVVVLSEYLRFTFYIKPACLEWEDYNKKAMLSNIIGRVSGWGKTALGLPSNELNMVELLTLSYIDCVAKTQIEYQTLITGDKFCVSSKDGQSVCEGDSGAGFLIPKTYKGIKRFVLQGIVSNGINSNAECTGDFLTAYTNIQFYEDMVKSYTTNFKVV